MKVFALILNQGDNETAMMAHKDSDLQKVHLTIREADALITTDSVRAKTLCRIFTQVRDTVGEHFTPKPIDLASL